MSICPRQAAALRTRQRRIQNKSSQIKTIKSTPNKLSDQYRKHFGDLLTPNFRERELLFGLLNIQLLPKTRRAMKNFDLTHLMLDLKFDQIGFVEIFRHWPSIQEEDINPQRFRGHFMSQQLDSTTA